MRWNTLGFLCAAFLSAALAGCGGGGGGKTTPAALSITTTSPLTSGTLNVAYAATLAATGGTAPYTWSSSGTLPKGLTLSGAGVLSGTPTVAGSSSFSITVTDSASPAATATLAATLVVNDSAITITTAATLPVGVVGSAYSQTLAATGGTPPYAWAGTPPAGLTLSSAGVLSGTPTAAGTSNFTITLTDSASNPGAATLAATLVVNPALAITAPTLPSGTVGAPYAGATFAATGGVGPYTWSIPAGGAAPPGLTLSSGGVLSGTPTSPYGSITVQVTDSETPAAKTGKRASDRRAIAGVGGGGVATQTFALVINPTVSSTPIPDGTYVFVFAGTSPQGTPPAGNAYDLNGTFTISNNTVVSGFYDENSNSGPVVTEQPITGGSLINYSDGLGTLLLNTGASTSIAFSMAIPATGSDIRIIEFDDSTGAGSRGSGELKLQTAAPALPTGPASFVFLVSSSNLSQYQQALACSFQIDGTANASGALNIVSLKADTNEITPGGTRSTTSFVSGVSHPTTYGSLAMDSHGRGVLTFQLGMGTFHFSFYQVSATEWFVNSADQQSANAPLASGSVYQQTGSGSFSAASLPATSVVAVSGLAPATGGGSVPDVSAGIATNTANGALAGTINFLYDEYNGTLTPANASSLAYSVDPVTGRVANPSDVATFAHPVIYIIDAARAFILFPGNSANSGILEGQTASAFADSSFSGSYLGGSLALANTSVLNEAGLATADGAGNFTSLANQSAPTGLANYVNVAGTYAVDPTGRVVATAPDGETRFFYVVSPAKVYYLTSVGGGHIGSFEQ